MKSYKDFITERNVSHGTLPTESIISPEILSAEDYVHMPIGESATTVHPKDPPAVLVMRRKSIRQMPGGQRVALYYVDKVNKYITLPYAEMQWSSGILAAENTVEQLNGTMLSLKNICEQQSPKLVTFNDGTHMTVSVKIAESILKTYDSLNIENKSHLSVMSNESKEQFSEVIDFAKTHKT